MTPADQLQGSETRRATDPPTLWLTLALGSILIHLVLFILASLVLTRTANVQLDPEPIAVEFVDPNAAVEQTAPSQAIAARPGTPSTSAPSNTQAQPRAPRSQPFAFNPSIEQPFTPPAPVQERRVPVRPQPQQPNPQPSNRSIQPQPTSPRNTQPQQPNPPDQSRRQTRAGTSPPQGDLPQGSLPGSVPNPSSTIAPEGTESQSPIESDTQIGQPPQRRSVSVVVSNPLQPSYDRQQQPAKPIESQGTVLINYPAALDQLPERRMSITVVLVINENGKVVDVSDTTLSSPKMTIDQADLDKIAEQIFEDWKFEPARNVVSGRLLKPPLSNLTIDVQIQFP